MYMPIYYRIPDITIYWLKICTLSPLLPTPVSPEPLTLGSPGAYGMRVGIKKLESLS